MRFIYENWERFCVQLAEVNRRSIPAKEVFTEETCRHYIVLKHDVETCVKKAYRIALIESKYGHRGSYYVQAYLLNSKHNVKLLNKMKQMGHEISYHYDVMDSNQGKIDPAILEFEKNRECFEHCGFSIVTVCQHGNPIVERKGYSSNRDFFRNKKVQERYPFLTDIMVDFPMKSGTTYNYYSDAGRVFKKIYDPLNNDIVNSDDKNVEFANLDDLFANLMDEENQIISIHPHRWTKLKIIHSTKQMLFVCIKNVTKKLIKIPFLKKIISKFYYLAKKI